MSEIVELEITGSSNDLFSLLAFFRILDCIFSN